jgi:tRNA1(Val) A37 N6-methylase TrmN6
MFKQKIEDLKKEDETLDSFYYGKILILQKKKGYRFSIDAPLLADFIITYENEELLELGTGCGVISLLLSIKPFKRITALEIQESLVDLAIRNVKLNNLENKITILHQDFSKFFPSKKFDVIFSNPPYEKKGSGVLSPYLEKAIARHEIYCDLKTIFQTTTRLLKKSGRAYFIYPTKREKDFKNHLFQTDLKLNKIRYIIPREGEKANLFLVEVNFHSNSHEVLPSLIIYKNNEYTEEMKKIFAGRENVPIS